MRGLGWGVKGWGLTTADITRRKIDSAGRARDGLPLVAVASLALGDRTASFISIEGSNT
jgi:hypothetical protein